MASWHRYASWLFSLTVGLLLLPGASPAADSTPELRQPQLLSQPLHRLPGTAEATDGPEHPSQSAGGRAAPATGKLDDSWQEPAALIAALQELAGRGTAGQWSSRVAGQINRLRPTMADDPTQAAAILGQLGGEADETLALALKINDRALARQLRKAGLALGRRVDVWRRVLALQGPGAPEGASPQRDPGALVDCLAAVSAATANSAEGPAWREYLCIDALHRCALRMPSADDLAMRRTAHLALLRLTQTPWTAAQQRFVSTAPVAQLREALWPWAAEPIGAAAVLGDIERYETSELPSDARRLAIDCQFLMASPVAARRELGLEIDSIYRNANVRIAVTERLLNDLMPPREPEYQRFADTVLNHPVEGVSLTKSQAAVRMLPDPSRARLALEITGKIVASSTSEAGPARFYNDSQSTYVATEDIQIDMRGVSIFPVKVQVNNDTQLRGLNTKLDPFPILREMGRGFAIGQYEQSKEAAQRETEQKLADRIRGRVEKEAREKLSGVVERLNQRVFDPLHTLQLDPQLIAAQTTAKRFWMRLRLAGDNHLGSHTPRPQAPAESLASLQIHESVFANGIERMQLAGRTFTMPQLAEHVARCLNWPHAWAVDPDNADVKITFAKQDPIVVHCRDGQVVVTVSLARLSKVSARKKWTNFQVQACYRPRASGRAVELVRDGVIHFPSGGAQLVLRGVFSRVFAKDAAWQLVPRQIVDDPRFGDTAITQLVVDDGWIGIALSPKPPVVTAARHRLLGRQ